MSVSMQLPPSVWILHWRTRNEKFHYRFTLYSLPYFDMDDMDDDDVLEGAFHIWNCQCRRCALVGRQFNREANYQDEPHWRSVTNDDKSAYYVKSKHVSLFPVWIERLKNKTLDRWLEEDVKDLSLSLPSGILRIIAMYALEPIIPTGEDEVSDPPIFLDSDKLVDLRILNSTCTKKTCTCRTQSKLEHNP